MVQTVKIRQYEPANGIRHVELRMDGDALLRCNFAFQPAISAFDIEDIRWYHEDYKLRWAVSSNAVINRIKRAVKRIGNELFNSLFLSESSSQICAAVRARTDQLRFEILDEVPSQSVPWEWLEDPQTGFRPALDARSFVRINATTATSANFPQETEAFRLLFIISRPAGLADIEYWSIANPVWNSLKDEPEVVFHVLRPSTFNALERALAEACKADNPYTAVHFDGHGSLEDPFGTGVRQGFLHFESPGKAREPEFIDGATVGRVLAANGVQHFSMNACRSADSGGADIRSFVNKTAALGHESLAELVLAEGVNSCVGMRQEIFPETAARFFTDFYKSLLANRTAGEAATLARRRLSKAPLEVSIDREIEGVDDWSIPIIAETTPRPLNLSPRSDQRTDSWLDGIPTALHAPAVTGFDGPMLALEFAHLANRTIHIVGTVLAGKSRLAAEFARWRSTTSSEKYPVIFFRVAEEFSAAEFGACIHRLAESQLGRPALPPRTPEECTDLLASLGVSSGLIVLDQVDAIDDRGGAPGADFLKLFLQRLPEPWKVIVTSRGRDEDWLPKNRCFVRTKALFRGNRIRLTTQWASDHGRLFQFGEYQPLVFFSGGLPGILLLLLEASTPLIERREATARDIALWLHEADWQKIDTMAVPTGYGLKAVGQLVAEIVGRLCNICTAEDWRIIRLVTAFQACVDEPSVARLFNSLVGEAIDSEKARAALCLLEGQGLLNRIPIWDGDAFYIHCLFKLIASKMEEHFGRLAPDYDSRIVDNAVIEVVARKAEELSKRFRTDTFFAFEWLQDYKQNLLESLHQASQQAKTREMSQLIHALHLMCRHNGDYDLLTRVLDHLVWKFIDARTGKPRSEIGEAAQVVWDVCVWASDTWPVHRPRTMGYTRLIPADDDHFGSGLLLRRLGKMKEASVEFLHELTARSARSRYHAGDVEYLVGETLLRSSAAEWNVILEHCKASQAKRAPNDAVGQCTSVLLEAEIKLAMSWTLVEEKVVFDEDKLDQVTRLLRKAESIPGGFDPEGKARASLMWSSIRLEMGDLQSATDHFEEAMSHYTRLRATSHWRYYWRFAQKLLSLGWYGRAYENAMQAFFLVMDEGNHFQATEIRTFCQRIESEHPEVADDRVVR
jgi:hypothetical protein